jgi:cytochrome c oxidase subunit 3
MEIGTAESIEDPVEVKRRRPAISGGSRPSGNGGGGKDPGGGGGDDGPGKDRTEISPEPFRPGISRILTGFLLVVVLMTFGGLVSAYIVIATNNVAEWRPFALPIQVWISTALIIASSFTYHIAKTSVDSGAQPRAKRWFIITTIIGAAFISSQILVWVQLTARGLYMSGNPYAGFFYILTAVHAVHVTGGIAALGAILLRTWTARTSEMQLLRRRSLAQVVGWYWHFMGALWIVLFVLLGFWK